ncbi:MAG: NUDIX hydrolase [Planctomycetaceae bacterium]|jgi:ADP-ribose pyrophosphatase|nr:NUDIX hydrolase [Planctomycetaceae bacterium]
MSTDERHEAHSARLLSSESLFRGRVFEVVRERIRLPSGLEQDLAIVRHPGAAGILPLWDDGSVTLVRQYRHAVGRELLEIPAGRLEPGEAPMEAARRELEEETGLRAGELRSLGAFFPAPGFCSEELHLFVATGLVAAGAGRLSADADEELDLVRLPLERALEACFEDAKSYIALVRLQRDLRSRSS